MVSLGAWTRGFSLDKGFLPRTLLLGRFRGFNGDGDRQRATGTSSDGKLKLHLSRFTALSRLTRKVPRIRKLSDLNLKFSRLVSLGVLVANSFYFHITDSAKIDKVILMLGIRRLFLVNGSSLFSQSERK